MEGDGDGDGEGDGDGDDETKREYSITVRGAEVLRYTLPDFFPDFNMTPLVRTEGRGPPAPHEQRTFSGPRRLSHIHAIHAVHQRASAPVF